MASTRRKSKMDASGGITTGNLTCVSTLTVPDAAIAYAKLDLASSISLGSGTTAQTTGDLDGVILSYVFYTTAAAAEIGATHGLGHAVAGWKIVGTDAPLASGQVIYCTDISKSTTTLTLNSLGTATIKVFAF